MGDFASQEPGAAAQRPMTAEEHPDYEAQIERENQAEKQKQHRIAEFNAHPHTQLTGILTDLRRPVGLDVNGRLATLHNAVARLAQLLIGTAEPPIHPDQQEKHDEEQRRIEEQPAVGAERPFTDGG